MHEPQFTHLPASARVWIYGSEQALTGSQVEALAAHMSDFLSDWRSHGREITPDWTLVHKQFVVIAVDESAMSLSGCSIDTMFRAVDQFGKDSGLNFSRSGSQVFYRDEEGHICCVDRPGFSDLARQGKIDANTVVFNNTILTTDDIRSGRWEGPLHLSWHQQAFGKSLEAARA